MGQVPQDRLFESLEGRTLLSRVFAPDLFLDSSATSGYTPPPGAALLDTGGIEYLKAESPYSGSDITRVRAQTTGSAFVRTRIHNAKTDGSPVFAPVTSPSGVSVFRGEFAAELDGDTTYFAPEFLGVGYLRGSSDTVSTVFYEDTRAPDGALVRHGVTTLFDTSYKVTVRFTDSDGIIDRSTLNGDEIRMVRFDGTVAPYQHLVEQNSSARSVQVTYWFELPAPVPSDSWDTNPSVYYTVELVAGKVRDEVDRENASRSLGGVRLYRPGAESDNTEWFKPPMLPVEKFPADRMVGIKGFIGRTSWSNWYNIDPLVAAPNGLLVFRAYDEDAWTTYWVDDFGIPGSVVSDYLPVSVATNGASVSVNATRTGILYSSGPGAAPQEAFQYPGIGSFVPNKVSSPIVTPDGQFIIFAADVGFDTGLFGASRVGGAWQVDKLLTVSDGVIEPGETWIDSNDDDHVAGMWTPEDGATAFVNLWSRLTATTPDAAGRFSIFWDMPYRMEVRATSEGSARLVAGVPELITRVMHTNDGTSRGLYGAEPHNPRLIASHAEAAGLLDSPVNARGDVAMWINNSDSSAPARFVLMTDLGLRPVLFLPGIFGNMPKDDYLNEWLLFRGFDPEKLVIDPIGGTYDVAIQSLIDIGHRLDGLADPTLYIANYDWRMPPAPVHEQPGDARDGPWRRDLDGVIKGINRDTLFDAKYEHGVEYLAYWLRKAKLEWESRTGRGLDSVDIYAHSTGGLVTRAYIQSDLYGDSEIDLPTVNRFISMAVPHRGASKAWNLMHDNMASDVYYKAYFSKVAYAAYWKLTTSGRPIGSATAGDEITLARLEQAVHDFPEVYGADTHEQALHQAFINLYIPTGRALLATYPFILDASGNYVPAPAAKQNALALDLNNGIDSTAGNDLYIRDKSVFFLGVHRQLLDRAQVAFFYGTAAEGGTFTHANTQRGPSRELIPGPPGYPPAWSLPYEQPIYPMDSIVDSRAPGTDEIWWADDYDGPVATARRLDGSGPQLVSRHGGDGTVPIFSGGLGFGSTWYARYYPQTDPSLNHGSINGDAKVLREVLKELNAPAWVKGEVPTWRESIGLLPVIATIAQLNFPEVSAIFTNDPVDGYLTDGLGRRLGWTQATGALREIPGGVYIGEGDGFGWIHGDFVAPLTYTFTGVESMHSVAVGFLEGDKIRTFKSEGPIGIGVTRTVQGSEFAIAGPQPSALRALLDAVPNVSVGPGGAITVALVNEHGRTTIFRRSAGSDDWTAREPDPSGDGGTPTSDAVTWRDPKDGKFYAAVPTAEGLLLFRENAAGQWTARNLTSEITGAGLITSKITQWKTNATRNNVHRIVGVLANGDVVQYEQTIAEDAGGYVWKFDNLSDDLRVIGQVTPAFDGRLVAYTTAWDAWHIAGLDADGQIQTIWRGPRMKQWVLSNLSTTTGAPPLAGGMTVYLTSWQGINLAGVDSSGQLQVTWWIPRFRGAWAVSNLTSAISAPVIDGESIVSFNTPAGGLNMAARTTDDEVVVFWWVPGAPGNKWRVQSVTDVLPPASSPTVPYGELSAIANGEGLTSIVGRAANGDVVRYFGSVLDQEWAFEAVSEIAVLE